MLSIDFLISVTNTHIVRVADQLLPPQEGVNYIISYQYSDDSYLSLIPPALEQTPGVRLLRSKRTGLSVSRNAALSCSTSDLVCFLDDDARLMPDTASTIRQAFESHPQADILLFQALKYNDHPLRVYPPHQAAISGFRDLERIQAVETVCRRQSVQGRMTYNEHFGLGSDRFTCYEQQVWLEDARRLGLELHYIPEPIIRAAAMYTPLTVYHDRQVQRSMGALIGYVYKTRTPLLLIRVARHIAHHSQRNALAIWFTLMHGYRQLKDCQ